MMKNIFKILLVALVPVMMMACENETKVCDQTLRTDTRVLFKYDSLNVVRDTIMPAVVLYALGRDTFYNKVPLGQLFLPLAPTMDSSRFYLLGNAGLVADTLTFRYKRTPHFVSAGCGFATFFSLDTVLTTHNSVDSLQIIQKEVTTSNDTHIILHFNFQ
jgi:hypothetical protein